MLDLIMPSPSPNYVIDTLWLGDFCDAKVFDGERLCVLEGNISYSGMTYKIPILTKRVNSKQKNLISAREGFIGWNDFEHRQGIQGQLLASRDQLDKCANLINDKMRAGVKLLVHCIAGIERSPLTVAWWLVKTNRYSNLDEAYKFLRTVRSVVEDRQHWIEP